MNIWMVRKDACTESLKQLTETVCCNFFIISQGSFYFVKGKSGKSFKTDVCGCHVEGNKPVLIPPGWEISLKLSM